MKKHVLFPVDEMKPGEIRGVTVDNLDLMLLRTPEGQYCALLDRCSHMAAKLSLGTLVPMITGDFGGDFQLVDGEWVVRCPWHRYEFDVKTGVCPADPKHVRVRSYEVTTEDGQVVVTR
jgi:nitrite reductase/ring-hydroxylating ferredoxin subunit